MIGAIDPGVAAALGGWRDWLALERRAAARTVVAYGHDLSTFLRVLAGHAGEPPDLDALAGLSPAELRAWLAELHRRGLSRRSIGRATAAVRGFYRYLALRHGRHNPAPAALRSPRAPRRLPRPLNPEQAVGIAEAAGRPDAGPPWVGARDRALLLLLYGTGLRIGEALSLTLGDLGPDPRALRRLRVTGKGGRQREVPVLPAVAEALADHAAPAPGPAERGRALFLGVRGGPLESGVVRKRVRELRRALGLPETATPHALRPQLRHPSSGGRRRPARHSGASGPRRPVDHPGLHRRGRRAAAPPLRRRPPPRLTRPRAAKYERAV